MELRQAFPIAIIDEDYEGKHAAGRGMRALVEAIEKHGFRIASGLSYNDARRLVNVANNESCWLVSVDGSEDVSKRWEILKEVLAAKRGRNDRLPIFLFGDFLAFEESFNRFPGFNYEVHGVYQERSDKGIEFYTYVVRE